MTITTATLTRLATVFSGVLALVLPHLTVFGLPSSEVATLNVVGGGLLAVLAYLEHPTTKAKAGVTPPAK